MTESRFKPRYLLFAAIGLSVVGAAVVLTLKSTGGEERPPTGTPPGEIDPGREVLAKLPEALRARPDAVSGQVRLVAERLSGDAEAIVNAIHKAVTDGHLKLRPIDGDAPDAPRAADALAKALQGEDAGVVGSLELATLAGALFAARGLGDPAYGRVPGARFDATELLARRYVVRAGTGPWLALDGAPLDAAKVVAFDDVAFMANVLGWRALGAMVAGDESLASTAANVARRLAPDDPAIGFVVGKAQINAGVVEMGVATLERVVKSHADALSWHVLGRMERLQDKPFRADQDFRKAIELDPTYLPPHLQLAELALERLDVTPADDHPGVLAQASAELDAARKIDPNGEGIRLLAAHIAALSDDVDKAIEYLREETKLHPASEDGWLLLAQVYAVNERDADAIANLKDAIAQGVKSADVEKALGLLLASSGGWDEAYPHLTRSLELNPKDSELRPQLAQLERARGNSDAALALLAEQVERFPEDRVGGLLLAQAELDAKHYDLALGRLDKIVAATPEDKEAVMLRYLALLLAERPAADALKAAIAAVGSRREVAEILLEQGRVGDAEALLNEALTAEVDDPLVPVLLVGIYVGTSRDAEAQAMRAATLARFAEEDHADINTLFDTATKHAMEQREAHAHPGESPPPPESPEAPPVPPTTPDAAP